MIPQSKPKKKKNSSKVNLTISAIVHGVIIVGLIYFAARNGFLGKKLKEITVYKVEKENRRNRRRRRNSNRPRNKPGRWTSQGGRNTPTVGTAPAAAPVVAPASSDVADFNFNDGAKAVNSESDPVQLYKGYIEYTLRSKWNRPENLPDDNYAVEVAISVDKQGNLSTPRWLRGSGDPHWDDSVKDVFKLVDRIDRRPPTNFPSQVIIRFDVQEQTEPVLQ